MHVGIYPLTLTFSEDYPTKPPLCYMPKGFFHPNVYESGKVCLSIINECGGWKPSISVKQVCVFGLSQSLTLRLNWWLVGRLCTRKSKRPTLAAILCCIVTCCSGGETSLQSCIWWNFGNPIQLRSFPSCFSPMGIPWVLPHYGMMTGFSKQGNGHSEQSAAVPANSAYRSRAAQKESRLPMCRLRKACSGCCLSPIMMTLPKALHTKSTRVRKPDIDSKPCYSRSGSSTADLALT